MLEAHLRDLPRLVALLERRDHGYAAAALAWLAGLESELGRTRSPLAGRIAALRAALLMADRGETPADLPTRPRETRHQLRDRVATWALREAEAALSTAISADQARLARASELAMQLTVQAVARGMRAVRRNGDPLEGAIRALWAEMFASEDLRAGCVELLALAGPQDTLILVERAISRP